MLKGGWWSHVGKEFWGSGSPGPVLCWSRHHLPKPPTVSPLSREGGGRDFMHGPLGRWVQLDSSTGPAFTMSEAQCPYFCHGGRNLPLSQGSFSKNHLLSTCCMPGCAGLGAGDTMESRWNSLPGSGLLVLPWKLGRR